MRINLVSDGRRHVAFCPDTVVAVPVDTQVAQRLSSVSPQEAASVVGREVLEPLASPPHLDLPALASEAARPPQNSDDRRLDRLVMHVTHDCNLRCVYCYADGGSYGGSRQRMERKTALAVLTWVAQVFGGVNTIQFFGGEPLLNPRLMIEICECMSAMHEAGAVAGLPQYGLVTNGVLGDDRAIDFMRRYGIGATVSIDGPEDIHDRTRGAGSFQPADEFARRCLDAGDLRVGFECTWTPLHIDMGVSPWDLVEFFHERYGCSILHVVPVSAPPGSILHLAPEQIREAYVDAARHSVEALQGGRMLANSLSYRVMDALRKREARESYCPAGAGTLSVAADGGVYPCFMFAGDPDLCIWRCSDDGCSATDAAEHIRSTLEACLKAHHSDCQGCWAAPLCSGCLGADWLETGALAQRSRCDTQKAIATEILLGIAEL